ncbi:MAG: hypothetical protein J6H31_09380 [Butyrivibrio sp.]|nr:hypothetical protein [Butyrivibrio sp.]
MSKWIERWRLKEITANSAGYLSFRHLISESVNFVLICVEMNGGRIIRVLLIEKNTVEFAKIAGRSLRHIIPLYFAVERVI